MHYFAGLDFYLANSKASIVPQKMKRRIDDSPLHFYLNPIFASNSSHRSTGKLPPDA